jgi:hypothetical protein
LGIEINIALSLARIPLKRLEAMKQLLFSWSDKDKTTKKSLQSLIGVLQFAAKVLKNARTFLRRMIDLIRKKNLKGDSHFINLNSGFRQDLEWWKRALEHWDGVSLFYEPHRTNAFALKKDFERARNGSHDLVVFTDASKSAAGGVFGSEFYSYAWSDKERELWHINYLELFSLVTAAKTWGHKMRGKSVLFWCDNMVTVSAVSSMVCSDSNLMHLVRELHFIAVQCGFFVYCKHIAGVDNVDADAASRQNFGLLLTRKGMTRIQPSFPTHATSSAHPRGPKR